MKRIRTLSNLGEFGWIATLQKKLRPKSRSVLGIGDDTAVVPGSHKQVLLTTDMLIEGRHFTRKDATAYDIGWKALAVNLSDIAAMAGIPKYALVAVGLPAGVPVSYLSDMLRGLSDLARKFKVAIVGGDTNRCDRIILAVTVVGEVEPSRAARRSGAKSGDWIFVTGPLGGSYASKKHLRFTPQIKLARELSRSVRLHAMMDISDGLLSDLGHLCKASRVRAVLFGPQIPLSTKNISLEAALTDGEDFELLFTVSPNDARKILASRTFVSRVYPVGRVLGPGDDASVVVLDSHGNTVRLKKRGFDHFKNEKD